MKGLDTNVLVRYLTQDEREQARKVDRLVATIVAKGERVYVNVIVVCELTWVLRSGYGFGKEALVRVLERILSTPRLVLEDREEVREALKEYREGGGDFSDYLIGARNRRAGCSDTATFDRHLKGSALFTLL
jgi:predicted nucleic-acid-binding protein